MPDKFLSVLESICLGSVAALFIYGCGLLALFMTREAVHIYNSF